MIYDRSTLSVGSKFVHLILCVDRTGALKARVTDRGTIIDINRGKIREDDDIVYTICTFRTGAGGLQRDTIGDLVGRDSTVVCISPEDEQAYMDPVMFGEDAAQVAFDAYATDRRLDELFR